MSEENTQKLPENRSRLIDESTYEIDLIAATLQRLFAREGSTEALTVARGMLIRIRALTDVILKAAGVHAEESTIEEMMATVGIQQHEEASHAH